MTVLDLVKQNPNRSQLPPESIFEAQDERGKKHLLCIASLAFKCERESMLEKWPTLPAWTVTKEHFTQAELDERKSV